MMNEEQVKKWMKELHEEIEFKMYLIGKRVYEDGCSSRANAYTDSCRMLIDDMKNKVKILSKVLEG